MWVYKISRWKRSFCAFGFFVPPLLFQLAYINRLYYYYHHNRLLRDWTIDYYVCRKKTNMRRRLMLYMFFFRYWYVIYSVKKKKPPPKYSSRRRERHSLDLKIEYTRTFVTFFFFFVFKLTNRFSVIFFTLSVNNVLLGLRVTVVVFFLVRGTRAHGVHNITRKDC